MDPFKILLLDDEEDVVVTLEKILLFEGFRADTATDPKVAIEMMKANQYELIVTDILMPEVSGIRILKAAKAINPLSHVILITGYSTVSNVVEALSKGAYDYFVKPFDDVERITARIREAKERIQRWRLLIKTRSFA